MVLLPLSHALGTICQTGSFTKQGAKKTSETNNVSKSVVHADTLLVSAAGQPPAKILIKFMVWWLCKLSIWPNVLDINISS